MRSFWSCEGFILHPVFCSYIWAARLMSPFLVWLRSWVRVVWSIIFYGFVLCFGVGFYTFAGVLNFV